MPKAFRPISLTSTLFKVIERILLNEIEQTTLKTTPLNPNQHAFLKGSSCDSALSDMVDYIEKSIMQGEYALGVFLDNTGACDTLFLESAVNGMKRVGLHPNISGWYVNYLGTCM